MTPSEASFVLRRGGDVRLHAIRDPSQLPAAAGRRAAARPRGDASPSTRRATPGGRPEKAPAEIRIGVISDNHGYLDPAVLELFAGVVHIIHAGDIVDPEILAALETIAPVTAVAGNMDSGDLADLPREVAGEAAGVRFAVGHKRKRLLKRLDEGRIAGGRKDAMPDLVVYGHDHIPAAAWVEGTLFLDPGSASAPHEEDDGPTVAVVTVKPAGLAVTFFPLEPRSSQEAGA